MTWLSISALVWRLRAHLAPVTGLPVREAGARVALAEFGANTVQELPSLVNFGALTVLAQPLRVHELRGRVPERVASTDLHSLPDEPPRLLRAPWILEVRDPVRERLFGSTPALAGYELDGTIYLLGVGYPDGAFVARWRPRWPGGDIEAGVVREGSGGLIDDIEVHAEWGRAAARFAIVLGLMLDAEGTPLRTTDDKPQLPGTRKGKTRPARPWAVRRIYLESEGDGDHEGGAGGGGGNPTDDLIERSVMVRGHLKRQRYGAGHELVKWIYVQSYEARRWFTSTPTRVVVS